LATPLAQSSRICHHCENTQDLQATKSVNVIRVHPHSAEAASVHRQLQAASC